MKHVKTLLILFAITSMGTMCFAQRMYVRGDFTTDWQESWKASEMQKIGDVWVSDFYFSNDDDDNGNGFTNNQLSTIYKFKFSNTTNWSDLDWGLEDAGDAYNSSSGRLNTGTGEGGNISFQADEVGTYRFTFDEKTKEYFITKIDPAMDRLYLVGDGYAHNWDICAFSGIMIQNPTNPNIFIYTGYLLGGQKFKFIKDLAWAANEYGYGSELEITSGTEYNLIQEGDSGYNTNGGFKVSENGFYTVTCNLSTKKITAIKNDSYFLIGSATDADWNLGSAVPLVQDSKNSLKYTVVTRLKSSGEFKIATKPISDLWDQYFFIYDGAGNKALINGETADIKKAFNPKDDADTKFQVSEGATYLVTMELNADRDAGTITINKIENELKLKTSSNAISSLSRTGSFIYTGMVSLDNSESFQIGSVSGEDVFTPLFVPNVSTSLNMDALSGIENSTGSTDNRNWTIAQSDSYGSYYITIDLQNMTIIAKKAYIWTGDDSSDWQNAENWTVYQVPTSTADVVIPKLDTESKQYPVLTGTKTDNQCNTITFAPGAELGRQDLLTYSNAIIQYSLKPGRWHLLSMPFSSTARSFFLKGDLHGLGLSAWLQKFKPKSGSNAEWDYYPSINQDMPLGEAFGYWNQGESSDEAVAFQIKTESDNLAGVTPTVPDLDFGSDSNYESDFALVGNPFMTSINFESLYSDNNSKIQQNYQIWTGSGFTGYNKSGTFGQITVASGLNNFIAPLQAFFVEKNNPVAGDKLEFNLVNLQATGESVGLRSAAITGDKLDIIASNETASMLTFIAKREDSQSARKLMNGFTNVPDVYTLTENGTRLGANIIDTNTKTIPVGLATSYKGEMSLTFSGMDEYDAKIKLIDTTEGKEIDLTGKNAYQYDFFYTPSTNNNNEIIANESRFLIAFSPMSVTDIENISEQRTLVYAKDNTIHVIGSADNPIYDIFIYDVQGRVMYAKTNINTFVFSVNEPYLNKSDICLVKVITKKGVENVKLIND